MSEKVVEFEDPRTVLEIAVECWRWRRHKDRIKSALRRYFAADAVFHRPITAIQYQSNELTAYRDRDGRWFDVTDW